MKNKNSVAATLLEADRQVNQKVTKIKRIREQDEEELKKLYADAVGYDLDEVDQPFEDAFMGIHNSEEDYAREFFDENWLDQIPKQVQYYIDYDAFARNLFINDMMSIDLPGGKVAVFQNI